MVSNWTKEQKIEMVKVFEVLQTIQKNYGRQIDTKATLQAWEFVLGEDYTADEVMAAMQAYMKQSSDMPTPADLIKIINPPPPKITYEQYKYAIKQHELEGYPMFGYFGQVIKDYEKQQAMENETPSYHEILEKRKKWELEFKKPKEITND